MNIVIIGVGYVGLTTGTCLAELGNKVIGVDIDYEKIDQLKQKNIPFFEEGLPALLAKNIDQERLYFTDDLKAAIKTAEIVFICVGTPPKSNGEADLKYVYEVARDIGKFLDHYALIINKSTVPVGTSDRVKNLIKENYDGEFDVVSNPEFLREGSALWDFMNPDRIIIGAENDRAKTMMEKLYSSFNCPKVITNIASAELIKYASNAFLATKISFINEIANVCENFTANIDDVSYGMGLDKRIGQNFLRAGIGYGGSCFPKDVRALYQISGSNGYDFRLLRLVIEINNLQKWLFLKKIRDRLETFQQKNIAVWGLTFKPNTDDVRESIALELISRLLDEGAIVKAYDPKGSDNAQKILTHQNLHYGENNLKTIIDADALLIITEWSEFKSPNWDAMKYLMRQKIIFDGRNLYNPENIKTLGFEYYGIGR